MSPRMRLLNPGPVTLTERVRSALLRPDLCHRESEFVALHQSILTRLASVYPASESFTAVMLTGSGTAAVEAMIGSLVPRESRSLVVINGVYGDRMASMLEAQGKAFDVVRSDWGTPLDLAAVEARLSQTPAIRHVLAVHHETTTGRLNDLPALGAICRKHDATVLLDAVSSFGGESLDLDAWGVEACAATANKCLHGVPGISFVLARSKAFTERPTGATSVYLDLYRHHAEQLRGSSPFTHSVQACYALDEALREFEEGGGASPRHARYAALAARVERGLLALGMRPLLPESSDRSVVLSAWWLPEHVSYAVLHDQLKERGFTIYAGQGKLQDRVFRVSVMGDLTDADIDELLEHVGAIVKGSGVA